MTVAATVSMAKPAATRSSVARMCRCSSPVLARSASSRQITEGGGTSRPSARPASTAASHSNASTSGRTKPRNSRANRSSGSRRACSGCAGTERCSAETVTSAGDMANAGNATRANAAELSLVPRDRHAVVDQVVDGGLHVDARRNDPGLLQGDAGGEDRLALRRADAVMGDLGALLELLVGDRVGQLGHRDERVFELVIMGERVFARLLVNGERALHEVGVILEELLAHVEDAPGVGGGVAIEQPRAVLDFRLRHHRVEPGPGVDIAADERGLAVRVL